MKFILLVALLASVATADRLIPMCKPHTRYEYYCNTCKCSSDGRRVGCTNMDCDPSVWNKDGTIKADLESLSDEESKLKDMDVMCEPLSTFKDYCNACRCSSDGKNAACTSMICDLSVWNKDGTVIKDDSESLPAEELQSEKPDDLCQTVIAEDGSKVIMCY